MMHRKMSMPVTADIASDGRKSTSAMRATMKMMNSALAIALTP